jgi:anti-anti-sigma factor
MEITVRLRGQVDVLDFSGKTIADGQLRLRNAFLASVARGRRFFVFNTTNVPYLDSITVGETVACFKRARERGGDVKLVVVPDGTVQEILHLTGLDRILEIYGDEQEALASFRGPA